jgi:cyclopropane fatty-acyl-phospholipid synthase-like methyltransferase
MTLEYNEETVHYHEHRKFVDLNWEIHKNFFKNVNDHLTEDGRIFLMENAKGSDPDTFKDMIEENGLVISRVYPSQQFPNDTWYLEIVKKGNDNE